MKKGYVKPLTSYKSYEIETLLIGASDQDPWADSKERGYFETTEGEENYHHADDNPSWGSLW